MVGAGPELAPTIPNSKAAANQMNHSRHISDERGQTMVEFAIIVPILLVIVFGIFQFGILYKDYVTLTDATRVGARKAAISRPAENPEADAEAALRASASGLTPASLDVEVDVREWERGEAVTVRASYPYAVNLLGLVVASGRLESSTTERVE